MADAARNARRRAKCTPALTRRLDKAGCALASSRAPRSLLLRALLPMRLPTLSVACLPGAATP
jgi:hypothetical protein